MDFEQSRNCFLTVFTRGQAVAHPPFQPQALLLFRPALDWSKIPSPRLGRGKNLASNKKCLMIFIILEAGHEVEISRRGPTADQNLNSCCCCSWRLTGAGFLTLDCGRGSRLASSKQCLPIFKLERSHKIEIPGERQQILH